MFHSPAVCFALYLSLGLVAGLPLGLGGCQVLLSQIGSPQDGASLETAITWKERDLARPLIDIQVHNAAEVALSAVSVSCEFQDSMGATIFRSRAFLPQALQARETQHLNGSSFQGLPRFERAKCVAAGM